MPFWNCLGLLNIMGLHIDIHWLSSKRRVLNQFPAISWRCGNGGSPSDLQKSITCIQNSGTQEILERNSVAHSKFAYIMYIVYSTIPLTSDLDVENIGKQSVQATSDELRNSPYFKATGHDALRLGRFVCSKGESPAWHPVYWLRGYHDW